MSEHTEGPYSVMQGHQKHKEARFIKAGSQFIGKVYGHDGQPVEANARLIAAAPEMLEALQWVKREMADDSHLRRFTVIWASVDAAIAKATGATQ